MAEGKIGTVNELAIIGGSAGGLEVILQLLPLLEMPVKIPLVLVLHRRSSTDDVLVDLLSAKTGMRVKEVEEKDMLVPGTLYIAPADYHLLFEGDRTCSLDDSEKVNFSRPSIDVSFSSAAQVYGAALVCILLSGANADGAEGMADAAAVNAVTIAQLPATADVPVMPQSAISKGVVKYILDVGGIAAFINGVTGAP